ncbi:Hypothetical predicted protein [Olea europaea subsp. europaea]|uniref:Uncharacterized protein n=1 Tax=Olea europaea subsp. europaea TaxID=158383 RepID=A0A8S0TXS3_OLEEU|nr:Hypothetical predicted protein [Olea europaea subsp. europaea]
MSSSTCYKGRLKVQPKSHPIATEYKAVDDPPHRAFKEDCVKVAFALFIFIFTNPSISSIAPKKPPTCTLFGITQNQANPCTNSPQDPPGMTTISCLITNKHHRAIHNNEFDDLGSSTEVRPNVLVGLCLD